MGNGSLGVYVLLLRDPIHMGADLSADRHRYQPAEYSKFA